MQLRDSTGKTLHYLAALSKTPMTLGKEHYPSRPIRVSTDLFRGFTCPAMCGGCCFSVTLDYLPGSNMPEEAVPRTIEVNGNSIQIYSILQDASKDKYCKHLDRTNGRCGIYTQRPMLCDVELIRLLVGKDRVQVTQKLHGRGWQMTRVTGERGEACEMTPEDPESVSEVLRKLKMLLDWAIHFKIDTWLPEILEWAHDPEARKKPLFIFPQQS